MVEPVPYTDHAMVKLKKRVSNKEVKLLRTFPKTAGDINIPVIKFSKRCLKSTYQGFVK
jgi:hypothetical protein